MRPAIPWRYYLLRSLLCALLLVLTPQIYAQPPVKAFVVKNGQVYITLSKGIPEQSLDSFIVQFDLQDLDLKNFMFNGRPDSLIKHGWKVEAANAALLVISRAMNPVIELKDPVEKIIFAQKTFNGPSGFANKEPNFGFNRFVNKQPFGVQDSVVTFFLRNQKNARRVVLAGSFNNWDPDGLPMQAVDSGWVLQVKLGAGKHYYKFIADGNWFVDKDNQLVENDGEGNDNSVYYKTNYQFSLAGYTNAKRVYVAGSFNDWNRTGILMNKTATGWEKPLYLADGTHTYRFVADGKWFADPGNPISIPNEFDETNSVVRIGELQQFFLPGFLTAKKVMLAGSFNQWRNYELPMQKTDSGWVFQHALGHGNYEYIFEADGKKILQSINGGPKKRMILVIAPNQTFKLKGYANAKNVYLAGDFNNWSPDGFPMTRVGDEWVLSQHLAPGKHVYKFVVDGKWIVDPANPLREPNEFREENSVIWKEEK